MEQQDDQNDVIRRRRTKNKKANKQSTEPPEDDDDSGTKPPEDDKCDDVVVPPTTPTTPEVDVTTVSGQFAVLTAVVGLSLTDALDIILRINDYSDATTKAEIGALFDPTQDTGSCFTGTAAEVTTNCNGECCIGKDACKWDGTATVCVGSCNGDRSCFNLEQGATILPLSCVGFEACNELGFEDGDADDPTPVTVGPRACDGLGNHKACKQLGANAASINIGFGSCNGYAACYTLMSDGLSGTVSILDYSCYGTKPCYQIYAVESVTIGPRACRGYFSCGRLGGSNPPKAVEIKTAACVGVETCERIGQGGGSDFTVTIGERACVGYGTCDSLGKSAKGDITIGDDACREAKYGCSEIGVRNGVGSVSVGAGSCTTVDYICYEFGEFLEGGGDVIIPAGVCTSTSDICGSDDNIGDDACTAEDCDDGDFFIFDPNPPAGAPVCDFCKKQT
mmetsp:Transcript_27416/g.76882  ORF Transcript_27416/g.76882 Transcript_27416/m.76882 type:complete len:451 (+) Transcript_27416:94-1446(+)|eukprot:CAMPEP_0119564290 /NCGR_PEP_ID=MMETSP1352-20130426/26502_1 /TAXON_ID=265584 /ORGANISM="Stauroneis constricta, Strain CCMP1120" /LENGTH=450 /DNA_ID=CAMNT_0007613033 /DNA_START=59 /DNA_END=1411 /DNA_ORIENTATION=-